MTKGSQEGARIRPPRRMILGDIAATVLVFAAGAVLLILTVRSVPAWWTTKFCRARAELEAVRSDIVLTVRQLEALNRFPLPEQRRVTGGLEEC